MSEDGESPQPEEQQPQQQKVALTFTEFSAQAGSATRRASVQRILAKRLSAVQGYVSVRMNVILCRHKKLF